MRQAPLPTTTNMVPHQRCVCATERDRAFTSCTAPSSTTTVSNKWPKKKKQNKNTSLSSSLCLVLCGSFTAPLTGLAYILQWFCCVSVVSCGHMHFLRWFRLYGNRFGNDSAYRLRVYVASENCLKTFATIGLRSKWVKGPLHPFAAYVHIIGPLLCSL